jgi:hypothetical protein
MAPPARVWLGAGGAIEPAAVGMLAHYGLSMILNRLGVTLADGAFQQRRCEVVELG